jgi:hypothetical protein
VVAAFELSRDEWICEVWTFRNGGLSLVHCCSALVRYADLTGVKQSAGLTLRQHASYEPYKDSVDLEHLLDSQRKAGLPK